MNYSWFKKTNKSCNIQNSTKINESFKENIHLSQTDDIKSKPKRQLALKDLRSELRTTCKSKNMKSSRSSRPTHKIILIRNETVGGDAPINKKPKRTKRSLSSFKEKGTDVISKSFIDKRMGNFTIIENSFRALYFKEKS